MDIDFTDKCAVGFTDNVSIKALGLLSNEIGVPVFPFLFRKSNAPCCFIIAVEIQVMVLVVAHGIRILHNFLTIPKFLVGWNM